MTSAYVLKIMIRRRVRTLLNLNVKYFQLYTLIRFKLNYLTNRCWKIIGYFYIIRFNKLILYENYQSKVNRQWNTFLDLSKSSKKLLFIAVVF
jgi:hypothetical protein